MQVKDLLSLSCRRWWGLKGSVRWQYKNSPKGSYSGSKNSCQSSPTEPMDQAGPKIRWEASWIKNTPQTCLLLLLLYVYCVCLKILCELVFGLLYTVYVCIGVRIKAKVLFEISILCYSTILDFRLATWQVKLCKLPKVSYNTILNMQISACNKASHFTVVLLCMFNS